jgi:hypothetical protein
MESQLFEMNFAALDWIGMECGLELGKISAPKSLVQTACCCPEKTGKRRESENTI